MCFYYKNELDTIKHMNQYELTQLKLYYENLLKIYPNDSDINSKIQTIKSELMQDHEILSVVWLSI